jgi:hypothetical protein
VIRSPRCLPSATETVHEHANGHANGHTNGRTHAATKKSGSYDSIQPYVKVAVSPNNADVVSSTIESIQSLGATFSLLNNAGRQELLAEVRRLVRALRTPRKTMIKHNWAQANLAAERWMAATNKCSPPRIWPSHSESISACSKQFWRTMRIQRV